MSSVSERDLATYEAHVRWVRERRELTWRRTVPARFRDARLEDLPEQIRPGLDAWCSAPQKPNLILCGPVGAGKTHAAAACARTFHERQKRVGFWAAAALLEALRPGGDLVRVGDVITVDLLVLDDLAVEKPSEWTMERLDLIVNGRWMDGRPIIVTSNLTPERLRQQLGERVWSRLSGEAEIYRIAGKDRRGG